jgi:hypothetical protein
MNSMREWLMDDNACEESGEAAVAQAVSVNSDDNRNA